MTEALDSALKAEVREVLGGRRPVTEAELRKLSEEGRACALILHAQLDRSESRLAELTADSTSPLAQIAAAFKEVNQLRPQVKELDDLLDGLQSRAREVRAAWVSTS
jgi:hypothetical protein